MNIREYGGLLKDSGSQWMEDKAPRLGAALAYYMIFSLAPLLVIVIGIAGLVFKHGAAESHVIDQMQNLVGEEGAKGIRSMVESAGKHESGLVGSILGIAMLLFGAAGLFGQLQDALNTIWEVEPKPGRGVWGFIQDRFLSISMVLGIAFLLMASLVVSAAVAAFVQLFGDVAAGVVGHVLNEIVSLIVTTLLFAMIFRFLPDAKIAWRDVWLGAALTALLFEIGKFLIGLYLGHSGVASAYGAAGSLAVLLIWLYYSSQIFLYGAEFTKAYANKFGSRIVPAENAVPVTEEARAQQGISRTRDGEAAKRRGEAASAS
ncbi:MAG: YihY/virulence factor BrkB family protein [Gemmataceae bacterium]